MNDNRENEESYECFIFCSKHLECGQRDLKQGVKQRIMPSTSKALEREHLRKLTGDTYGGRKKNKGRKYDEDGEAVINEDEDMQSEVDEDEEADGADELLDSLNPNRKKKKVHNRKKSKKSKQSLKVVNHPKVAGFDPNNPATFMNLL